ncbi:methyl-accepting chemotaxis protein [Desulforamulus aeronauticus]|uniref:HAMP domain-containing protein n=1 Tax=Desulforamulus aeronauticus DSM 10349 TaxID=1121421 RepID=A0A1M6UME6_9FIRM|nr:methyl-accepting chemotaxis protein [Desulforamulus aeronauticus]MCL4440524.1 methyl-accepting chemotaxis protein [Bacillota bacterium]SHK70270.1 HAMP domain-containing protein [Desulforamulus aeronauticus DSM 10349]SHK90381.1 HAMP domain-containing protein [Desulforamulus aeronauticus DSM 10349]SHL00240.1 HAMP domain-containing protein [Desulforamulus aeronauticus DSM 10349]
MKSLSKKIPLLLGVTLAIIFLLVGYYTWQQGKEEIDTMAQEQAQSIVTALDASIGSADRMADHLWLQGLVKRLATRGIVEEISLHEANHNYEVTASSDPKKVGEKADPEDIAAAKKDQVVMLETVENGQRIMDITAPLHEGNQLIGSAGIKISMASVARKTSAIIRATFITMTLGWIVSILFLSWLILKLVVKPVQNLSLLADHVAAGNLTVGDIHLKGHPDEIGRLAQSFSKMKNSLKDIMSQQVGMSKALTTSALELTQQVRYIKEGATRNETVSEEILSTVVQVAQDANQVSSTAEEVSQSANRGMQNMEQVNQQMDAIIQSSEETVRVIGDLNKTLGKVNQIVVVIQEITERTNILALNATIEAARAGEHGYGFSVVAEEVKRLAEQSSTAAGEIDQLIARVRLDSQKGLETIMGGNTRVKAGVTVMREVGQDFQNIIQLMDQVVTQFQSLAAAVKQIPEGVENIVDSTREQTAALENVASASVHLSQISNEIDRATEKFKI